MSMRTPSMMMSMMEPTGATRLKSVAFVTLSIDCHMAAVVPFGGLELINAGLAEDRVVSLTSRRPTRSPTHSILLVVAEPIADCGVRTSIRFSLTEQYPAFKRELENATPINIKRSLLYIVLVEPLVDKNLYLCVSLWLGFTVGTFAPRLARLGARRCF